LLLLASAHIVKKGYSKLLDYSSGYVWVYRAGVPNPEKKKFVMDHVALIPRSQFVQMFAQPQLMAKTLHAKGLELAKEWKKTNEAASKVGQRTPCEKVYKGFEHEFYSQQSKFQQPQKESSIYELSLNTFHFTQEMMSVEKPPAVTLADVRVSSRSRRV
jgi:hypothetical protein